MLRGFVVRVSKKKGRVCWYCLVFWDYFDLCPNVRCLTSRQHSQTIQSYANVLMWTSVDGNLFNLLLSLYCIVNHCGDMYISCFVIYNEYTILKLQKIVLEGFLKFYFFIKKLKFIMKTLLCLKGFFSTKSFIVKSFTEDLIFQNITS